MNAETAPSIEDCLTLLSSGNPSAESPSQALRALALGHAGESARWFPAAAAAYKGNPFKFGEAFCAVLAALPGNPEAIRFLKTLDLSARAYINLAPAAGAIPEVATHQLLCKWTRNAAKFVETGRPGCVYALHLIEGILVASHKASTSASCEATLFLSWLHGSLNDAFPNAFARLSRDAKLALAQCPEGRPARMLTLGARWLEIARRLNLYWRKS